MKISIITTAYNEEKNILPLCRKIKKVMGRTDYEVIAVDDGSSDSTYSELRRIKDRRFRVMRLRENQGKSLALYRGLEESRGEVIATIDSDLQDDPRDILRMVEKLGKGYDCICGWRHDRKYGLVKRVSSRIGNLVNNCLLGVNLHDNNCPVKVFRRECLARVRYFDGFHRFIPAMVKAQGFGVREYRVRHHPRIYGVSKYGIRGRIWGNLKTILMVRYKHKELLKCN